MAELTATMATRRARESRLLSSLRMRLAIAIAVSVGVSSIAASAIAWQLTRQARIDELRLMTVRVAERAAESLERLPAPLAPDAAAAALREITRPLPQVDTVWYLPAADQRPVLVAGTGGAAGPEGLALATRALGGSGTIADETRAVILAAAPIRRPGEPTAAVLIRTDLGGITGFPPRALLLVAGVTVLALVALVVLVDRLARPLVTAPIQQLRDAMARVSAGDFGARVPVVRRDEIGEAADDFNRMLERLEGLQQSLQLRVREVTTEVEERNQQLVDTYHRVFGLREQLASAEQLASVGQTAANVAHQVGTPLNLISGYVQLLKEELGPASPHLPRLAIIEEQIAKVTSTVRTLLDRSRQMGRKTRTTAGSLVGRVCEVMKPNLDAAGIRLELTTPVPDPPILVDATNLELALLNLMTNAVDAMAKGGILRVDVTDSAPTRVKIEISDTGHGIPDDLLQRIFEPWVSTKQPGRGTGLGLPIARDVVAAHGGTISVRSAVGQGTTFTIDLPSDAGREAAASVS